jgi:signal transduction histidine kinase
LQVSTGLVSNGSEVSINFSDSGIGISAEDLPRVFEPFFTTRSNGTGLGLAITYTLVERHGGRILVESQVNRGSSFKVILPIEGIVR